MPCVPSKYLPSRIGLLLLPPINSSSLVTFLLFHTPCYCLFKNFQRHLLCPSSSPSTNFNQSCSLDPASVLHLSSPSHCALQPSWNVRTVLQSSALVSHHNQRQIHNSGSLSDGISVLQKGNQFSSQRTSRPICLVIKCHKCGYFIPDNYTVKLPFAASHSVIVPSPLPWRGRALLSHREHYILKFHTDTRSVMNKVPLSLSPSVTM